MLKAPAFIPTTLALASLTLLPAAAAAQARSAQPVPAPRTTAAAPAPARPATAVAGWKDSEYRLGPGDKLRIEVFEQEQLSQSVQIRPDGKITLPFVQEVTAAGQTPVQLREALTASLKEYVVNPVVTVVVQEAVSAQFCVQGEVRSTGCHVMSGPTTVLEGLARAGGVTEFAKKNNIGILRKTGTKVERIPFDYKGALNGDRAPVYLQPDDHIVVP